MKGVRFLRILAVMLSMVIVAASAALLCTANDTETQPENEPIVHTPAEEAAYRLYYLGLFDADEVDAEGNPSFDLNREVTRLDALMMILKFLGLQDTVAEQALAHPYTDVPEEASAYVGYAYANGYFVLAGEHFEPDEPVNSQQFLSAIVSVLGYEEENEGRIRFSATALAVSCGIIDYAPMIFTREHAATILFNAMNTKIRDTKTSLTETLAEDGVFDSKSAAICMQTPIDNLSLMMEKAKVLEDGLYTVSLEENGKYLNASMGSSNTDKAGTKVNLWSQTNNATQMFRVEGTDRGTYYLYSAASGSGTNRMLGFDEEMSALGLYNAEESAQREFYIIRNISCQGCGACWMILPVGDSDAALTCAAEGRNGAPISLAERTGAVNQSWIFHTVGAHDKDGVQYALLPLANLKISQGVYGTYSHRNKIAIDVTTNAPAVAPFDAKVVKIDRYANTVWIQSQDKVFYADGSYDYMTVGFMHDNNISDIYLGRTLVQGEPFYHAGTSGDVTGTHIHLFVFRGAYQGWSLSGGGNVMPYDAFFLTPDIVLMNTYNYDWIMLEND